MQLVVDGLLFVLLLTITIFMFVNHLRLQKFIRESAEMPYLTKQFTETLEKAQQTMRDLVHASQNEGAVLTKQLEEARKLSTEIDYMLHRSEKQIQKLENQSLSSPQLDKPVMPEPKTLSSVDALEELARQQKETTLSLFAKEEPEVGFSNEPVGKAAIKPVGLKGVASAYAAASEFTDMRDFEASTTDERSFLTQPVSSTQNSAQDKLRLALEEALK